VFLLVVDAKFNDPNLGSILSSLLLLVTPVFTQLPFFEILSIYKNLFRKPPLKKNINVSPSPAIPKNPRQPDSYTDQEIEELLMQQEHAKVVIDLKPQKLFPPVELTGLEDELHAKFNISEPSADYRKVGFVCLMSIVMICCLIFLW
jgi:hypothetical protein